MNFSGKNPHLALSFIRLLMSITHVRITVLILLLLPVCAAAQSSTVDSLAKLLRTIPADTHRVSVLTESAWNINEAHTEQAITWLNEAIALAQRLQFVQGEATAWNGLGVAEEIRGDLNKAISHYQKALALRQELNDLRGVAASHNNLGNTYELLGQFDAALTAHRESLAILETLHDTLRMARTHLNMSGVYEAMGVFPEAYDQVNAARLIFEAQNDTAGLAKSYTLLGHIRFELAMLNEAYRWYTEALRLQEKLGDPTKIADALSDLGIALDEMGNADSSRLAVQKYLIALKIRQDQDDQPGIAAIYNNLGVAYKHLGQYERGMFYLQQSLALRKEQDDQPGLMEVYNSLGDVVYGQGNNAQALQYTEQYFKIAQTIGDEKFIQRAYKDFGKIYAAMGNFAKAYEYRVKYDELRYKRLDESRAKVFEQKEVLFSEGKRQLEIQRKQHELDLKSVELDRSGTVTKALSGGALALMLVIGLLYRSSRIRERARQDLAAKNEVIQRERERSNNLLRNILPEKTAEELLLRNAVQPVRYESVTVLFSDFKGFTTIAELVSPESLVAELDECFRLFDAIIIQHGLEKIKTIGDAYMCAGGLPTINSTHAEDMVRAAIEMQRGLETIRKRKITEGLPGFEMRIGIHTGPVVAGVVGSHKFAYDIWGDTVNTAARLEQGGEPNRINISETTYQEVKHLFQCTFRGKLAAKNKGEIAMYFVENSI